VIVTTELDPAEFALVTLLVPLLGLRRGAGGE